MVLMFYYTIIREHMSNTEYNNEPVFYCKDCLSLKIRDVEHIDDSEYCDACGSTDIGTASIEEWDAMYVAKYGHHFTDKY
jgi:hypothetical protein